jgi:hypothetical protein
VPEYEEMLRRLSVRDNTFIDGLLADETANASNSCLDPKAHALVRIGALVAVDAAPPSYMEAIVDARRYGASNAEIVGCLVALLPTVGVARVVSAAPKVGLALGYDVEAALEAHAAGPGG